MTKALLKNGYSVTGISKTFEIDTIKSENFKLEKFDLSKYELVFKTIPRKSLELQDIVIRRAKTKCDSERGKRLRYKEITK